MNIVMDYKRLEEAMRLYDKLIDEIMEYEESE